MDCTEYACRSSETPIACLIADLYRAYYDADMAMVNGGSIRGDLIIKKGPQQARVV